MNLQAENPLGLAKQTDKPLAQKVPEAQMPRADSKAEKRSACRVDIGYTGEIGWRGK